MLSGSSQGCHLVELGMRVALRPDLLPWLGHNKGSTGSGLCPSFPAGTTSYSGMQALSAPSVSPSRPTCKPSGVFIPWFSFGIHQVSRAT